MRFTSFAALVLLGASAAQAADAGLDASIAKNRMGTLVIHTAPGAKVTVEQVRHEFWFGATLPGGVFSGRSAPKTSPNGRRSSQPLQRRRAGSRLQVGRHGTAEGPGELHRRGQHAGLGRQGGHHGARPLHLLGRAEPRPALAEGDERRRFQGTLAERGAPSAHATAAGSPSTTSTTK